MEQKLLPENCRNKYESHIEKKYESSAEIQVTYRLISTENLYFKSFLFKSQTLSHHASSESQ